LLQKIDDLPQLPEWQHIALKIVGNLTDSQDNALTEDVELWYRNPVSCVQSLIGNSAFDGHMQYAPVRIYNDANRETRAYEGMETGDWWWNTQVRATSLIAEIRQQPRRLQMDPKLEDGATIAPVIIASDKTSLSVFSGDKAVWPVYCACSPSYRVPCFNYD
jgi:hypothetical protein